LLARSDDFRGAAIKSMSGATGRQRVQEQCFADFKIVQPPHALLDQFVDVVAPSFRLIYRLHLQTQNLRKTRDLLLPRLMSGQNGIKVSVPDGHGGQKTERLRVMDWENPVSNDFLLVNQFSVTGALYTHRPELVGFVNGLPLVVIELKNAFDDNLTCYKSDIPQLLFYNALLIASNGTDSRVHSRRIGNGALNGNA
jgi:hypothetical protein